MVWANSGYRLRHIQNLLGGGFGRQLFFRATEAQIKVRSREGANRERSAPGIKMLYTRKAKGSFKCESRVRSYEGRYSELYSLILVLKLCFWGYRSLNTMGTVPPGTLSHGDLG